MEPALAWTSTPTEHSSFAIFICTDSKSLCEALLESNHGTYFIYESINSISSTIYNQWIPGNSDIPGNELAYKAAKKTTTVVTKTILPVSLSSSLQVINNKIRDNSPTHEWLAQIYQHQKPSCDLNQMKDQKDDMLIARLRSCHHPSLHQYLHRPDPAKEPIWLCDCPAGDAIRQPVFGCHKGSLEWFATRPVDLVAYARKTLVNLDV